MVFIKLTVKLWNQIMLLIISYWTFLFEFFFFFLTLREALDWIAKTFFVSKFTMYNFASDQGTCTVSERTSYDSHATAVDSHSRQRFTVLGAAYQEGFRVMNLSVSKLPDERWLVLTLKMWINQCYWGLFITENFVIYTWDFDKVLKWFILRLLL